MKSFDIERLNEIAQDISEEAYETSREYDNFIKNYGWKNAQIDIQFISGFMQSKAPYIDKLEFLTLYILNSTKTYTNQLINTILDVIKGE